MKLEHFALDHWLNCYTQVTPPIEFDIASSTGPHWTIRGLIDLVDTEEQQQLLTTEIFYSHPKGNHSLREAIAKMEGVDASKVQIVTGGAEALLLLFFHAAEPNANVVVPSPGFPTFSSVPASFGIEVRPYHLRAENGFNIDSEEIKRLVDSNTKIILINSPHNPTGTVLGSRRPASST